MMATEAIPENIATTSILTENDLTNTPEDSSTSNDVSSTKPVIKNNNVKHDTEFVELHVNSAEVSVSGGSDTEASKSNAKEKGHIRTASTVKKPASFKPVSVNKTFLAAKITAPAAPSKLGEKGVIGTSTAPAGPLVGTGARPRLVAKSGSSLQSAPRSTNIANRGKAGGAPDASAVWNKNRPAPPPEPSRFTDEELKQRYGIHLATRLQADDQGKQANWADIDDDDEDWAPDTMEWADGTKVTLPQADETRSPASSPAPITVAKDNLIEPVKPKSPPPAQPAAPPASRPSGFGGRTGLILKGASEKPTLVAKPPGPATPVKSPWAALPPVEKVAPVAVEALQQNRLSQRDLHGSQAILPPPPPPQPTPPAAKEIAADDFTRSWRDVPHASRELYNAQSGRYEPANDPRRSSLRNDARAHQPAVLQRPPQDGPAEPSAAFQTHRASGQDGYGIRRRTSSSNISGGSGNVFRRMSRGDLPLPHDVMGARRGSLAAVSDEPSSPRNFSPSGQPVNQRGYQVQSWQLRPSPVTSHHSIQSPQGPVPPTATPSAQAPSDNSYQAPPVPYEDPFEVQKKAMQLKRELAIARRREEEEREESERKERIRIKLESMGPPPDKAKKDSSPKAEKSAPTLIQPRETIDDNLAASSQLDPPELVTDPKATMHSSPDPKTIVSTVDSSSLEKISLLDYKPNGIQPPQGPSQSPPPPAQPSQDGRTSQSWQNTSTDRFKPWAPAPSQQSTSRNVWGPPTNDRTLGNGTFNPELGRLPEISSHPGPIGPPTNSRGNSNHGQGREYVARPAPIAPPNKRPGVSAPDPATRAAVVNSGWSSLPRKIAEDDAKFAQQHDLELARIRELREKSSLGESVPPMVQDTWRQVSVKEDGSRTKIQANHVTIHNEQQPPSRNGHEEAVAATTSNTTTSISSLGVFDEQDYVRRRTIDSVGAQHPFNDAWRSSNMNAPPPARGSRFFPSNRDLRIEEPNHNTTLDRPGSPSPPPPTQQGHPAYDGDIAHPHVSLPRPSPVVKLPPPTVLAPIGPPKPTSFAAAVATPVHAIASHSTPPRAIAKASPHQDVRREEPTPPVVGNWQDKINSLIGRKNSPKSHALAVDSSSKSALEVPHQQRSATVSLPSLASGDLAFDLGSVESKPVAEVCFEEQEMGSLPPVKLPVKIPKAAWDLAPAPKPLARRFLVLHTTSIDSITFPAQMMNSGMIITIKFPGQDESTTVPLAMVRQRSNPRRVGPRGGISSRHSSSHPRGRGRDASIGFSSPSLENTLVVSTPHSGRRGGRGGFGGNWNRHASTPVHT